MYILRRFYSTLSINKILSKPITNNSIKLEGWIKSIRKMKENIFLDISDGSSFNKLQVILKNPLTNSVELKTGSSVSVTGTLKRSPKGQLELDAEEIKVIGICSLEDGYPFAPRKTYNPEYIRQYLHFRSRTQKFASLLRVRHGLTQEIHSQLHDLGYTSINTPILTSNDCEGAGEVFTVQPERKDLLKKMQQPNVTLDEAYFNSKVFLTVSGQLHLEAMVHGLGKVYTLGPTFRAENSRSRLHLSEFYMLEVETAFLNNLLDLASFIQEFLKIVTLNVLKKYDQDVRAAMIGDLDFSWTQKEFPILTFNEATKILKGLNPNVDFSQGFSKEDEILLVKHCGNVPVFIVKWPKEGKPFYMKECKENPSFVEALDLLAPNVGEIAGGSLREDSLDKLKAKLPSDKLNWYLQLRQFGGVPTGGFGLGLERYLQLLLGVSSIKDTIPFPRWPHNCNM